MAKMPQKGPKFPGFRGSSLAQAIQGNFDHLMASIRELMRGHNLVVDDIEALAGGQDTHTVELGQHEERITTAETDIDNIEADAATERSRNNRKPPAIFYDVADQDAWVAPPGDRGVDGAAGAAGATGATGAAGAPAPFTPWPGEQGDEGFSFAIPGPMGATGAAGTSFTILGSYADYAALVAAHPSGTLGDGYITQDDGHLWVWTGAAWTDLGSIQGPAGADGAQGDAGLDGHDALGIPGFAGDDGNDGYFLPGPIGATGAAGALGAADAGSRGTKSTSQSVAGTGTLANVSWDQEDYDTHAYHDNVTANSRFTVPSGQAGYYIIEGNLNFEADTSGERRAVILLNGATTLAAARIRANSTGAITGVSVTAIYYLNVGDYVQFQGSQDSGGALDIKTTSFGGLHRLAGAGLDGAAGATGSTGPQGSQGVKGDSGMAWFGSDGEDGFSFIMPGPKGDTGATGAAGADGSGGGGTASPAVVYQEEYEPPFIPVVPGRDELHVLNWSTKKVFGAGSTSDRFYLPWACAVVEVYFSLPGSTVSEATVDVKKNGTSIFGTKPTTSSGYLSTHAVPAGTNLARDDYLTIVVDKPGSAGGRLKVYIVLRRL